MLDKKFLGLQESLKNNQEKFEKFITNPIPALEEAGIPLIREWSADNAFPENVEKLPELLKVAANPSNAIQNTKMSDTESVNVEKYWWGIDVIMNEKLTEDITNETETIEKIGGEIACAFAVAGILTEGVAAAFGLGIAVAFAAKVAEIKIIDNGSGVHWPVTWLQWAPVIAAVPAGPVSVTAACIVFIHPLRNRGVGNKTKQ